MIRDWRATIESVTESDVIEILDALDAAGIDVWIDGGWGVDALAGHQTREHQDLDLAIDCDSLSHAQAALEQQGFRADVNADPGLPARLVMADRSGWRVDLHPLRFDGLGNGWQQLSPAGDRWSQYPAPDLQSIGVIGGRTVRCLSPNLQLQFHRGYEPRDTDLHDVAVLTSLVASDDSR